MRTRSSIAAAVAFSLSAMLTLWLLPGRSGPDLPTHSGEISLLSHTGAVVTKDRVLGHPYVLHFGYTHCPDICPTVLAKLSLALHIMGPDASKMSVFFVTVDPERDRPSDIARYVEAFHSSIVGLWAPRMTMQAFIRSFGAHTKRTVLSDGSSTIEHTTDLIFVDAQGKVVAKLDPFRLSDAYELTERLLDLVGAEQG